MDNNKNKQLFKSIDGLATSKRFIETELVALKEITYE